MKFFGNLRWKMLRLLVALLPLHAGFAQAAMVMPLRTTDMAIEVTQQIGQTDAELMPDGQPCHHQEQSQKGGCCEAGHCHCTAACGVSFTIARIGAQPGIVASPFSDQSLPAASRPPDLRPPII